VLLCTPDGEVLENVVLENHVHEETIEDGARMEFKMYFRANIIVTETLRERAARRLLGRRPSESSAPIF
jgi:hypothetical protein